MRDENKSNLTLNGEGARYLMWGNRNNLSSFKRSVLMMGLLVICILAASLKNKFDKSLVDGSASNAFIEFELSSHDEK